MSHHHRCKFRVKNCRYAYKVGNFQHTMVRNSNLERSARIYVEMNQNLLHVGLVDQVYMRLAKQIFYFPH